MKRKLTAALLTAATLALGACGSQGADATDTTDTVDSVSSEQSSDAAAGEEEKDYSEHLVISLASIQVNESTDYNNGDEFTNGGLKNTILNGTLSG